MLANLDVLADGEVGHQIVKLEDETELAAAILAELLFGKRGECFVAHAHRAAIGRLQAADDVQKRRLARARRAKQHAYLAFLHRAAYAAKHLCAGIACAIGFLQVFYLKEGGGIRC